MSNIVHVQRANVILDIKEEQKQRYVDMGYDVIDDKGNVIVKSVPQDILGWQTAYADLQKALAKVEAENAKLKAQLKEFSKPETEKKSKK